MPKVFNFDDFLKTWSLWSNSVTRQVIFDRTKMVKNAKSEKFKWDILCIFQTVCFKVKSSTEKKLDDKHVWNSNETFWAFPTLWYVSFITANWDVHMIDFFVLNLHCTRSTNPTRKCTNLPIRKWIESS